MPGHVGTNIVVNTGMSAGVACPRRTVAEAQLAEVLPAWPPAGSAPGCSPRCAADDLRQMLTRLERHFRDKARSARPRARGHHPGRGAVRGLADTHRRGRQEVDAAVRAKPEAAYDYAELFGVSR